MQYENNRYQGQETKSSQPLEDTSISRAGKYPLIVFYTETDDEVRVFSLIDQFASKLGAYITNRAEWLLNTSPAIRELIHNSTSETLNPKFLEALHTQQLQRPTLVPVVGMKKTPELTRLLQDANLIVHITKDTQKPTPLPVKVPPEKVITTPLNEEPSSAIGSVQDIIAKQVWSSALTHNKENCIRISVAELAEQLSVPFDEFGDKKRYTWGVVDVESALSFLKNQITTTDPLHIDGMCPAFLACAIATAFPDNPVVLSDPKVKNVQSDTPGTVPIYDDVPMQETPNALLEYDLEEREDYTFVTISIPKRSPNEQPWFDVNCLLNRGPDDPSPIELPNINKEKGVVLSGRLPLILFVTLARSLQKHGVAWVAPFTPQQTRDANMIAPAMKVCGDSIEYINVFPFYIEAFPIDAIEKTLASLQEILGESEDGIFNSLQERVRKKYNEVCAGVAQQKENEELFRIYAELMAETERVCSGLQNMFDTHDIVEKEATQKIFLDAIRLLTEEVANLQEIKSKLEQSTAHIRVFGSIIQQVYGLSKHTMDLQNVKELTLDHIGIEHNQQAEDKDPSVLLDHANAPKLWEAMQNIYKQNYQNDPNHLTHLLQQFPHYLQERLDPTFYLLYFSAKQQPTTNPDDLIQFIRFTNLFPKHKDNLAYRYIGALNSAIAFQGYQLHMPFITQCCAKEFRQCDVMIMRAHPRLAKIYKRTMGTIETTQEFTGEYPSGDASVLLQLTKEEFLRRNPHFDSSSSSHT